MTEEEAKTKWCPAARVAMLVIDKKTRQPDGAAFSTNRWQDNYVEVETERANCIASACMWWRGKETESYRRRADAEYRRSGRAVIKTSADTEGFCGLAGQPS